MVRRSADAMSAVVLSLICALMMSVVGFLAGVVLFPQHSADPTCSIGECLAAALANPLLGAFVGFLLSAFPAWWFGLRWFWMPLTLVLGFATLFTWPWLIWGGILLTAATPLLTAWLARPRAEGTPQRPSLRRRR